MRTRIALSLIHRLKLWLCWSTSPVVVLLSESRAAVILRTCRSRLSNLRVSAESAKGPTHVEVAHAQESFSCGFRATLRICNILRDVVKYTWRRAQVTYVP